MLVKERVFEESYSNKKIYNLKVNKDLDFYYISKNSNNDVIISLNKIGYVRKSDYKVLKLYEKEFINLRNKAIQNICEVIFNLKEKFDNIIQNHNILNKNDNELLSLLLTGKLHNNNREKISNFTNDNEIIDFINNYSDYSQEKFQKSIFRLNYLNQIIKEYKSILNEIHSITYSDIMK